MTEIAGNAVITANVCCTGNAENAGDAVRVEVTENVGDVPMQDRRVINKLIDGMTLFDDDLMSRVFDNNIEAAQLVLGIIFGRKLRVISVEGQVELKSHEVGGRTITLDVVALDENGSEINIEVQGNSEGAHVKRARYHSSMVDSRMLREGQRFAELKDSYVIFIYKHDKFRMGLPVYHVDRYVRETNEAFEDGSHILYVNGSYKGNDEIGHLMQDFRQINPDEMKYRELADSVKHYKETKKGRENVCEAVEKYAKEYAKEYADQKEKMGEARGEARGEVRGTVKAVRKLMDNMKLTMEEALDTLEITGKERTEILEQLNKNDEGK